MNWVIGGVAVLFLGPLLLRKASENPEALKKGAAFLDKTREKGVELTKKGAKFAMEKGKQIAKAQGLGATAEQHASMALYAGGELDTWTALAETTLFGSKLDKGSRCIAASATLDSAFTTFGQLFVHDKSQAQRRQHRLAVAANAFRDACVSGGSGKMPRATGSSGGPYYSY